jgi:hemolysin activation/secretion protein
MNGLSRKVFTTVVFATALLPQPAPAITMPSAAEPGHIEQRLEEQQAPKPPAPVLEAPAALPAIPMEEQRKLAKQHFLLKHVLVRGATAYTPEQLAFAWQGIAGKEVSLLDAENIAGRITALYRKDGYLLSQAVVPAQTLKDGILTIRVIEGFISDVQFEGEVQSNHYWNVLESYADELKRQHPINAADIERVLLLINDLPGASARGLMRPSPTQFGGAELVVTLIEKSFDGSYTLDNRGSRYVGPLEHFATLTANSALGLYDRTTLSYDTTRPTTELRYIDLKHEEQIGNDGTRLALEASHSRTEPGDVLKSIEIVGDSRFFGVLLSHPFIRSRQENLTARAAFDVRDTDSDVFKTTELSDDRLRVLRAGGSYNTVDRFQGLDLVDAQVSQGLIILGASAPGDQTSHAHADGNFTKFNLDLARTQSLPVAGFSVLTAASGQYAFRPLLAAEQFTLGGANYGRAYDPADLSGDHGLAGKIELRYGESPGDRYLQSWQIYSYYDIGRVWELDSGKGADNKKSLDSAGLGMRATINPYVSGYLELGIPLTLHPIGAPDGHSPRLFFSIAGRF